MYLRMAPPQLFEPEVKERDWVQAASVASGLVCVEDSECPRVRRPDRCQTKCVFVCYLLRKQVDKTEPVRHPKAAPPGMLDSALGNPCPAPRKMFDQQVEAKNALSCTSNKAMCEGPRQEVRQADRHRQTGRIQRMQGRTRRSISDHAAQESIEAQLSCPPCLRELQESFRDPAPRCIADVAQLHRDPLLHVRERGDQGACVPLPVRVQASIVRVRLDANPVQYVCPDRAANHDTDASPERRTVLPNSTGKRRGS